ncbi:EutN/CcmL family microcompartment protein [candidate division WOR-3 bacterium]|nr:EutN/CcmL family microcompartment protein [candidate division WOR-3 bacterium]
MIIGKVVGSVCATKKEPRIQGFKLPIVRETKPAGEKTNSYHIAAVVGVVDNLDLNSHS